MFNELGALSLKNISRPVEAFVLRRGSEVSEPRPLSPALLPSIGKAKLSRFSVIVAPLRNLAVPKDHEYLVEGIPEDIATDLSHYPGSFVVDSPEALRRAGDSPSTRDIARELGVVYAIQGSIRGVVDQLSVNLQLIDAETGVRLWSERFDIDLDSTADIRNETINRVTLTVAAKLIEDISRRIEALPQEDWTADDLVIRGIALSFHPMAVQSGPEPNRQEALRCFDQALTLAPDSIPAKIGIAGILILNGAVGQNSFGGLDDVRAEQLLADVLRVNGQSALAQASFSISMSACSSRRWWALHRACSGPRRV